MMLTKKLVVVGFAIGAICTMLTLGGAGTLLTLADAGASGPVIRITASKFHFTPDRITLTKGQPVTLEVTSTDITHGFMIRALKIDTDLKPGKVTRIAVTPAAAGTFRGICDHYCGSGHGGMKMTVVVEDATAKAPERVLTASR